MPQSLQECSQRGWPWHKDLHLSLSIHSLLGLSIPTPPPTPLLFRYSFTPSFHLPIGIFKFTHVHLFHKLILHSLNVAKPPQSAPLQPLHHSMLHSICIGVHSIWIICMQISSLHETNTKNCILISETPGAGNEAANPAASTTGKYTTPFKMHPTFFSLGN